MKLKSKILSRNKQVAYLTFENEEKINFKAGQFLIFEKNDLKRAYSIASSPLDDDLSFYVKKVSENGMSKYLTQDIKVGDEIKISGPFGNMFIDHNKKNKKNIYLFLLEVAWDLY